MERTPGTLHRHVHSRRGGAGVIFIAIGYNLGGPALVISVQTLVLNLILTGIFVVWVKKLALRTYTPDVLSVAEWRREP